MGKSLDRATKGPRCVRYGRQRQKRQLRLSPAWATLRSGEVKSPRNRKDASADVRSPRQSRLSRYLRYSEEVGRAINPYIHKDVLIALECADFLGEKRGYEADYDT